MKISPTAVLSKLNYSMGKQLSIGLALTVALTSAPAYAQDNIWLEEVVVTAQKRAESVQDVPIAINAIVGDQLDALGVQDTDDLVTLFPNLSLQNNSSINTGVTIRGVGTNNWHITGLHAVGQYQDEVSLFSPFTSQLGLFDMERVEVLRGPQNTLFGRNTTGGAVNYISRKPSTAGIEGYGFTNIGNEGRIDVEGALNIPFGDRAALRIAGQTVNRDGIFHNAFNGKKMGNIERSSGRVQLLVDISDRTEILVNGHVGYNRSGRVPSKAIGYWDPDGPNVVDGVATPAALAGAPIDCPSVLRGGSSQFKGASDCLTVLPFTGGQTESPTLDGWRNVQDGASDRADVNFEGGFLRVTHELDNMSIVSITAYDQMTVEYNQTLSGISTGQGFMPGQSGHTEVFSQEIRLTSANDGAFRWIAGGYYSNDDSRLATIIYRTDSGGAPFGIVPSIAIDQEVDVWSGYGQVEYDFTDKATFTLGLRYTDDRKTGNSAARVAAKTDNGTPVGAPLGLSTYIDLDMFDQITLAAADGSRPCPPPVGGLPCRSDIPVKQVLTEWGGKAGIDYRFTDDIMGYASYSRGFKSGAFDTRALAAFQGTADQPTEAEFLDAYEVGVKSTLADGALDLNGAVFFYQWDDLQVFDVDNLGRVAFLNIPESELIGAEIDIKWTPTDSLYIQAGVGWLDTEIKDAGTLVTPVEGAPLPHSPEWSLTGLIIKTFPVGNGLVSLQTNIHWMDERNGASSGSRITTINDSWQWNARATYEFGGEQQYQVAFWIDNITAEKTCGSVELNGSLNYMAECRNPNGGKAFYGVNLRYDF